MHPINSGTSAAVERDIAEDDSDAGDQSTLTRTVLVRLQGGLGNQMFQYAIGRALSARSGGRLILDLTFLLDRASREGLTFRDYELGAFAGIQPKFTRLSRLALKVHGATIYFRLSQILTHVKKLLGWQHYVRESSYEYLPEILKLRGSIYLDGYWQSPKYFADMEAWMRRELALQPPDEKAAHSLGEEIDESESVAVHIRRGDFVSVPSAMRTHGFIGLAYYHEAMNLIACKTEQPTFYFFSDDIEWCMENVVTAHRHVFVGRRFGNRKSVTDLWLMSRCRHFIISNSTFSWWAAWLSEREEKIVVAPRVWAREEDKAPKDLIPSSWLRL